MRPIRAILFAATAAASAIPSSASAAVLCHLELDIELRPNVSMSLQQATVTGVGSLECTENELGGMHDLTIQAATGPIGHWCGSDLAGTGTLVVGDPEDPIATGEFSFSRAGTVGAFDATTTAGGLQGYFRFEPEGDCVSAPVTRAHVSGDAIQG